MSDKKISSTTDIRVRYAETDGMKVVYHGNYLVYFEEARTNLFRTIGIVYAEIERSGTYLVVLESHLRYKRSAYYDDVLHVTAFMEELPAMKVTIRYEVTRNAESGIIVTGETVHAFIDARTNKPIRPPQQCLDIMKPYFT